MKHCFVINPAAGNGKTQEAMLPRILDAVKKSDAEYELHRTSGPGEATSYVRSRLAKDPDETVRFYVCGGDGTAAEVLNGLYGAKNAELAIVPAGSGNDYIRNFGTNDKFRDIAAQLAGEAVPVDAICYTFTPATEKQKDAGDEAGEAITAYAINMINMGFDAKAVRHMQKLKNRFFIKGTGAYIAGVLRELAGYKMSRAIFRPEGHDEFETSILLAGVGNGRFSGGGFDGIPGALVDDGLLDLMVIEPLTRTEFIRYVGVYHDGKHPDHPVLKERMRLFHVTSVEIEPVGGLVFTVDGEAHFTNKTMRVSLAPEKVRFVIPKNNPE